jgi:hypothetical protein
MDMSDVSDFAQRRPRRRIRVKIGKKVDEQVRIDIE